MKESMRICKEQITFGTYLNTIFENSITYTNTSNILELEITVKLSPLTPAFICASVAPVVTIELVRSPSSISNAVAPWSA